MSHWLINLYGQASPLQMQRGFPISGASVADGSPWSFGGRAASACSLPAGPRRPSSAARLTDCADGKPKPEDCAAAWRRQQHTPTSSSIAAVADRDRCNMRLSDVLTDNCTHYQVGCFFAGVLPEVCSISCAKKCNPPVSPAAAASPPDAAAVGHLLL